MSMSRSRPRSTGAAMPDGHQDLVNSSRASRGTTAARSSTNTDGPEWRTARWKLQVEAEARSRLKKIIRNVGSER
jgi:hypothetical protein